MNFKELQDKWLLWQFKRPQQLAFLIVYFRLRKGGMGPSDALEKMAQADEPQWQIVAKAVNQRLINASHTSTAFKPFLDMDIYAVLCGPEQTAEYEALALVALKRLKEQAGDSKTWMAKLVTPLIYIGVILFAYSTLATQFFPAVADIAPLPTQGPEYWVYLTGLFIAKAWPLLLILIGIALFGIPYMLPRWAGQTRLTLDKSAPLSLYRELAAARMQRQLSILMDSGNSLRESLDVMLVSNTPHTCIYLCKMRRHLIEGVKDGVILDQGLFNAWDINELKLLSGISSFGAALSDMAEDAQKRADERVLKAATKFGRVLFFVMGLLLIGMLTAIISPMMQMLSVSAY